MISSEIKYVYIIIFSIFLSSCGNGVQNIEKIPEKILKNDKEYISLSYFHIFKKNIPNNLLEKCTSIISTTSDKELVKDLIIRSWVFKIPIQNQELLEEDYYKIIYDSSPLITNRFNINELLKLINFYIFSEIYTHSNFQIINDGPIILKNLNNLCPKITGAYDKQLDCLKKDEYMLHQAIKNKNEIDHLINYFNSNINKYRRLFSSANNEDTYNQLKSKVFNVYPMLHYLISEDSIDRCLEDAKTTISIPNLNKIREDIPTFIEHNYNLLLSRQPTKIEMSEWTTYYADQPEAIPGMILYIIMRSDEYKYF